MHHIKAVITKQNGKKSTGRGFSPNELKKAGINKQQTKQMSLPVDVKRKSVHDENIATIKAHWEKAKESAQSKPKPETLKAEEKSKKKAKS